LSPNQEHDACQPQRDALAGFGWVEYCRHWRLRLNGTLEWVVTVCRRGHPDWETCTADGDDGLGDVYAELLERVEEHTRARRKAQAGEKGTLTVTDPHAWMLECSEVTP